MLEVILLLVASPVLSPAVMDLVAVLALSPEWTSWVDPDLTCYLALSKDDRLSAEPITTTNLVTFRCCSLVGDGTACAFITFGSLFFFPPGVATLLLLADHFFVDR